ncbi:MAG: tetratricopeptide repeat protein [Planctomycetota bacterium]|jgi:thioredoxin-like negative regulator of GroEL
MADGWRLRLGFKWYHMLIFVLIVLGLAVVSLPRVRERGMLLKRAGKYAKAEPLLLKQYGSNPYDEKIVLELADLYHKNDDPQKAIRILEGFFAKFPGNFKVRKGLVKIYTALFNYEKAIFLLESAPESQLDEKMLFDLFESAGFLGKAIALHKSLMRQDKDDIIRWREIERLQRWQMNIKGIIEALENIIKLNPDPDIMLELLHTYSWKGMEGDAFKMAAEVEKLDKLAPRHLRAVKAVYLRQKKLNQSIRLAEKICKVNENTIPQDWLDLSTLHLWSGDIGKALASVKSGLEIFKENQVMLKQAADFAYRLKEFELSGKYLVRLAELTDFEADWRSAAQAFNDAGNFKKAAELLAHLKEEGIKDSETVLLKASIALNRKERKEAELLAENLSFRITSSEKPDPLLITQAAVLFNRLGDTEKEAELLSKIADMETVSPAAMLDLAAAYGSLGRPEKGLEVLEKIKGMKDLDKIRWRREAAWLKYQTAQNIKDNEVKKRQSLLEAAEAMALALKDAKNSDLANALTGIYIQFDQPEKAKDLILQYGMESKEMNIDLAASYIRKGLKENAGELLNKMGEPADLDVDKLAELAYLHGLLGNKGVAIKLLHEAVRREPGRKDFVLALADAYGSAGDREKQYEIVDGLAEKGNELDWLAAADRRLWNNERETELIVLERGRQVFPQSISLLARQISSYAFLGKKEKAQELKSELLARAGDADFNMLVAIADSLYSLDEHKLSEEFYSRAEKLEKEDLKVVLGLARVNWRLHKHSRAEVFYNRFLKLSANDLRVWYELGEMKFETGRKADREFAKVKALAGNLSTVDMLSIFARIDFREGRVKSSIIKYKKAIEMAGEDPDLNVDLAEVYIAEQMYDRALQSISMSLNKHPDNLRLNMVKAAVLIGQREHLKAALLLRGLYKDNPENVYLAIELAYIEDYLKNRHTAEKLFSKALVYMEKAQ